MRMPPQPVARPRPRRRNIALLALLAAVILLLVIGQALAGFWTNFLWFHSSGVGNVWSAITLSKVLLSLVFFAVAFVVLFVCLTLVDTVVTRTLFLAPDTELVRRYQQIVAPHALVVRIGVSFVISLGLGAGATSQWQNWLLFEHAVPFHQVDPVFGRDLSFFVFRLPFLSFLVDWMLGALVVAFIVTAIAYFLNGAIRIQGSLHIEPRAIAHLSILLSLMALERAWAYYFVDRFTLDITSNGYVRGAGYTDIHVRLPAIELLAIVSLVAFVVLALNVYLRTWTLPAISVGLWALLAIVIGVIFPSLVQLLKVTPSQSTLETTYISRNISATRSAIGLSSVKVQSFPASQDLTPAVLDRYNQLLDDVQLWDPVYSSATFTQLQDEFDYYELSNLAVDRYDIGGKLTPVVIGVRELYSPGLHSQTWVNTHLEYTHGYGAVVAQSNGNQTTADGGNPPFLVQNVPLSPVGSKSLSITQPDVYFAPGDDQYVIVDTKQSEVDYQPPTGSAVTTHYQGSGGVPLTNLAERLAFAVHLHDFNLLISNEITSKSKLIYIPDVRTEVQTAFPFLTIDSNPYPVIDNGQIEWLVDGYTESNSYPYAATANTSELPAGSALNGTFNYVRDAVKVEVNAYTGKMTLYSMSPSDPILQAWEKIFPGLVHPLSSMDPTLKAHLRYPQDLFMLQSTMYAEYHVTSPSVFYEQQNLWDLSPTSTGANGSPSSGLQIGANGSPVRYSPIYEMMQLSGQSSPTFDSVEPLVRSSSTGKIQNLTSILVASSANNSYGAITAYDTPSNSTIDSPGLANADIAANPTVSQALTLLDSKGSAVTLGTVQILPIADSLLYVRPLYVSSSQTNYPLLEDVVVLYGKQVAMAPTLDGALDEIFGATIGNPTSSGSSSGTSSGAGATGGTVSSRARSDIAQALTDYNNAQSALANGKLGLYQSDIDEAGQELADANQLLKPSTKSSASTSKASSSGTTGTTGSSSTTTTTVAASTTAVDPAAVHAVASAATTGH